MTETTSAPKEARDIFNVLADMPAVTAEMTEEFQRVLEAVRDTGKKGTISLTIGITPNKADENIKELTGVVKAAAPRRTPKPTIMFEQRDGSLARSNPATALFDNPSGADIRPTAPAADEPVRSAPTTPDTIKEA